MKRVNKSVFFIVLAIIAFISYTAIFGISTTYADRETVYIKGASDIRLGIDMQGGVEVTFVPTDDYDATDDQMKAAEQVIVNRLVAQNITDYEIYTDYDNDRIVVTFPWSSDETDFNPEDAIEELGQTASLTFREGYDYDSDGQPTGEIILEGSDVDEAYVAVDTDTGEYMVILKLLESGQESFTEATTELAGSGYISIWMDDYMYSAPFVNEAIDSAEASITGDFTAEEATELAATINSGALPFALTTENYSTVSPTLGTGAMDAMILAGIIAFLIIAAFIIYMYRLPGAVASIALIGQIACTIAAVSGYFTIFDSFTLTLPGIAGIVLAVGMGVDANIIAAERIKEEIKAGKTIDGAIDRGFKKAFYAVLDGNITVIIVAVILMGAFGASDSLFATLLDPVFFLFGSTTTGTIYSFGYTLLVGVLLNFVMGVAASRLMLKSISKFKCFRDSKFYCRRMK